MPQEPAYVAERSQDGEAKAASERAKDRMFGASVRRRGMGSPELSPHEVAPLRTSSGLRCSDRGPHTECADYGGMGSPEPTPQRVIPFVRA